jgi:hypothetical protein
MTRIVRGKLLGAGELPPLHRLVTPEQSLDLAVVFEPEILWPFLPARGVDRGEKLIYVVSLGHTPPDMTKPPPG